MERLLRIQQELKVPKKQFNAFAKYNYRSCEDILEALKPVLDKNKCVLVITDNVVPVLDRVYVEATATLYGIDGKEIAKTRAYAREEEQQKGKDASQITGSASSYARKYALNGLFGIDDTKDADTMDNRATFSQPKKADPFSAIDTKHAKAMQAAQTPDELIDVMAGIKESMGDAFDDVRSKYTAAYKARLAKLQGR